MTTTVTCPGCAQQTTLEALSPSADAFCPECDYPLFWAPATVQLGAAGSGDEADLRRLPGTAGHVAEASFPCPACTELNPVRGVFCVSCGAELRPAPVAFVPPPAPEPPPPPPVVVVPPPKRPLWPIILGVLAAMIVVSAIILGGYALWLA